MTNLDAKFNTVEGQLAAQHTELLARIDATNSKLDALITASGGTPPGAGATLDDLAVLLADIHTDTQSMDTKLLRIRNAISPLDELLPVDDRSSIAWSVYRLADAVAPAWPRPTSVPLQPAVELLRGYLTDAIGVDPGNQEAIWDLLARVSYAVKAVVDSPTYPHSVIRLLSEIWRSLGIPTGDATSTVLGLLASIQYMANRQALLEQGPVPGIAGMCLAPYVGSVIQPLNGRNYVTWQAPAPTGLTITNPTGLPVASGLQSSDWSGWKLYVWSKSASVYTWTNASWIRNVNQYETLSGNFTLQVSVPDIYDLKAYLCKGDDVVAGGAIGFTSVVSKLNNYNRTYTFGNFPSGQTQVYNGGTLWQSTEGHPVFLIGDYNGWKVRNTSATSFAVYNSVNAGAAALATISAGATYTITVPTSYIFMWKDTTSITYTGLVEPPLG